MKDALLVRVVTDDAEGWGEVGAETTPTYAPDTLDTARLVLHDELVPRLFAGAGFDAVRGHHAAKAALAGAVLDAQLRAEGSRSLPSRRTGTHVPRGRGAIGTHDDLAACSSLAAGVRWPLGYRSLKLKIAPGHDVDVVAAVRAEVGPERDAPGRRQRQLHARRRRSSRAARRVRPRVLRAAARARRAPRPRAPRRAPAHADRSRRDDHERAVARDAIGSERVRDREHQGRARRRARRGAPTHDVCVAAGAARAGGMLETGVGAPRSSRSRRCRASPSPAICRRRAATSSTT